MTFLKTATLGLAGLLTATAVIAGGHSDLDPAVKARQSHMQLYAFNLGILGGMAQGKADYDAEAAARAAANLDVLNDINQLDYWKPGTDSETVEGSRSLPALWENFDQAMAISADFEAAIDGMVVAAGTDLASLQAAMGPLGGACSACHREFRQRSE